MHVDVKELLRPVNLCDHQGRLLPEALGWSRHPVHSCQIPGNNLRKKRWNYWFITSPKGILSFAIIHLDYIGLGFLNFIDPATDQAWSCSVKVPLGKGIKMGENLVNDVSFNHKNLSLSFTQCKTGTLVTGKGNLFNGNPFSLSLVVSPPAETLNVVIPWSERRFHFTSKQTCRPTEGTLKIGETIYSFTPLESMAILDFGRGIWPYNTKWNWTACSSRNGKDIVGFNFGSGWTDGTDMNENGIFINGKIHKLSEQIRFIYNPKALTEPWRVETTESDQVRLQFNPIYHQRTHENFGIVRSTLHQLIGKYNGIITTEDGEVYLIKDQIGICEEQFALW